MFFIEGKTFTWSDDKNRINQKKHGLSFEEAVLAFLDPHMVIRYDEVHSSQKESRWKGIGILGSDILLAIIFTEEQENELRLISARKASKKEKEDYRENIRQIFGP